MALEDLLNSIQSKAEAEAAQIIRDAEEQADKILNEARLNAETEAKRFYNNEVERCEREANQKFSKASLELRNKILNFKSEMVQKVFTEALTQLQNLDDKTYKDWLKRKIISAAESGGGEIIFSVKDKNKLDSVWQNDVNKALKEKGLKANFVFKFETTDFEGGFILKHPDYEIVMTLEDVLEELKEKLATTISDILFENDD